MKLKFRKAIVLGGSKGIGKEICNSIKSLCKNLVKCSRKEIDTSNLESVNNFLKIHQTTDILILNSGGPPPIQFKNIRSEDWYKYFNQLFLGYCKILQKIRISKGGYIFYISSSIIKEPSENLIISSAFRLAFSSVLKSLSLNYSNKQISIINIAPGPFRTNRVKELIKNLRNFEKTLPTKKIGNPKEVGNFVKYIIKNRIKYISGSTVYFDGNLLKSFI